MAVPTSLAATPPDSGWVKSDSRPGFYKLGNKEIFSYGSIGLAMNLVLGTILMFLTIFYTDVFGIQPGHVMIIFLLSRLWDAINDPLMGWIVERCRFKSGKYKPWIRWAAVPFGLAAVLTFLTPSGSYTFKIIWAVLTYNLLNMLFTVIIQPAITLTTVMTADPDQRTKLQSISGTLAGAGGVIVALTVPLLSGWLASFLGIQASYAVTVGILAVVLVAILLFATRNIHERIQGDQHIEPPSIKELFIQAVKNKYVLILFLLFLGVYGFNTLQTASVTYYMIYFAARPDLVAVFGTLTVLPGVFAVPLVPWFVKRLSKRGTVLLGLATAAAGAAILIVLAPDATTAMLAARSLSSFGNGILMGSLWAIITDAVEYGDLSTGKRYPAIIMTLIGLGIKFSIMIGGAVPAWILDITHYKPNSAVQTPEALAGIHFMTSWLPAIILGVTIVIFAFTYDLTEAKVSQIQHKIAERNREREVALGAA